MNEAPMPPMYDKPQAVQVNEPRMAPDAEYSPYTVVWEENESSCTWSIRVWAPSPAAAMHVVAATRGNVRWINGAVEEQTLR